MHVKNAIEGKKSKNVFIWCYLVFILYIRPVVEPTLNPVSVMIVFICNF